MSCEKCEHIADATSQRRFYPPDVDVMDPFERVDIYTCTCGQGWWMHNSVSHSWVPVANKETMLAIINGCHPAVHIGDEARLASQI